MHTGDIDSLAKDEVMLLEEVMVKKKFENDCQITFLIRSG